MLIRTLSTNLVQLFCKMILAFQIIGVSIKDLDDNSRKSLNPFAAGG